MRRLPLLVPLILACSSWPLRLRTTDGSSPAMGAADSGLVGSPPVDRGSCVSGPPDGDTFTSVSVGQTYFACGLKTDGTIACWVDNCLVAHPPAPIPPAGTFVSVSAGAGFACGLKTDNTIACWGSGVNLYGRATPPAGTFTSVSVGTFFGCGVRTDGTVACWGSMLGPPTDGGGSMPTPPTGVFASVSTGRHDACGLRTDSTVDCWSPFSNLAQSPTGTFASISVGNGFACGVRTDRTISCWGQAVGTPPEGTFTSVSAGGYTACGVEADGTIACWGTFLNGQPVSSTPPAGTFTSVSVDDPGRESARAPQNGQQRAPEQSQEQAVRPGIGIEDERVEGRGASTHPNVLDAGEQEERPKKIQGSDRRHEPAERSLGDRALRGEGKGKVADEHEFSSLWVGSVSV